MLTELTISNLAIIDRQSLSFSPGFNVISGETGAGKSIILSALEFILGGKLPVSAIRSGAELLEVEALFDLASLPDHLRKEMPDLIGPEAEEVVVHRTLPREGRGKILINGRLATVTLLNEIVGKLVNICSQHHHTRLMDPVYHLELLDGFAGTDSDLEEMQRAARALFAAQGELATLRARNEQAAERRLELESIVSELSPFGDIAGLRTRLEGEIRRLANSEKLVQLGQVAQACLSGDEAMQPLLRKAHSELVEMARLDPELRTLVVEFEGARAALSEVERRLDRYVQKLDLNEELLEEHRELLSELARVERKYRRSDSDLAQLLEEAKVQLSKQMVEAEEARLTALVESARINAEAIAKRLTETRKKAAEDLARVVLADLKELNMGDASLEVRVEPASLSVTGADLVTFLISTNRGEPYKPLKDVASGGELSRITLVLKKALRERSGVNVLIFDEVDTGVSGGVARAVGEMLRALAQQSQVVCITHLPQVASLSDRHFLVSKEVSARAKTVVKVLSDAEKIDEIARMLAGYEVTDASRASARELIASKS